MWIINYDDDDDDDDGDNLDNKRTPMLSSKLEQCVHYCKCSEYNLCAHRLKRNVHCIHLSGITEGL